MTLDATIAGDARICILLDTGPTVCNLQLGDGKKTEKDETLTSGLASAKITLASGVMKGEVIETINTDINEYKGEIRIMSNIKAIEETIPDLKIDEIPNRRFYSALILRGFGKLDDKTDPYFEALNRDLLYFLGVENQKLMDDMINKGAIPPEIIEFVKNRVRRIKEEVHATYLQYILSNAESEDLKEERPGKLLPFFNQIACLGNDYETILEFHQYCNSVNNIVTDMCKEKDEKSEKFNKIIEHANKEFETVGKIFKTPLIDPAY